MGMPDLGYSGDSFEDVLKRDDWAEIYGSSVWIEEAIYTKLNGPKKVCILYIWEANSHLGLG